jgi:DNA-binding winged helix-turn-helix (wHTH) protein/TolB-like protein
MESSPHVHKTTANKVFFADFQLDLVTGELFRNNEKIKLASQPALVLCSLVKRRGEIVSRKELQNAIWDEDTFVDFEQGLNWCIRQLRAVLGDDAAQPRFIETVPKRGYRFLPDCEPGHVLPAITHSRPFHRTLLTVMGGVSLVLAMAAAPAWRHHQNTGAATVLVLPMDNFTGDEKNESVTDGMTDQMIAGLGSANPARLRVIDRITAAKFKRSNDCILHIGKQLHADFVLVASMVSSSRGLRISAGLFRVADNTQVWTTDAHGLAAIDKSTESITDQIASLLTHRQ